MKQLMTTLAVGALGVGLVAGAHAQTTTGQINGTGSGTYQINLTESTTTGNPNTYQYVANLASNSSSSPIDTFTFNFGNPNESFVSETGGAYTLDANKSANGVFFFSSATGLMNANDQATFTFSSPLPPGGAVAIGTTSDNGNTAGGTGFIVAPGGTAAVPEPATLALLGLGAAPLALVARRRLKG